MTLLNSSQHPMQKYHVCFGPWNNDYTRLSLRLRQGVKWHDGQPFTAKDVNATGTRWPVDQPKSCALIRARRGTATSTKSKPMATMKQLLY